MGLSWVTFGSVLPLLAFCSSPDKCEIHKGTSLSGLGLSKLVLESLQCHNDYMSHVRCSWREHAPPKHAPLELWAWDKHNNRAQRCERHDPPVQHKDGHTVSCTYNTEVFVIGTKHMFYFNSTIHRSYCSSLLREPLNASQFLRVRPPVNLSVDDTDQGHLLRWSSPYPTLLNKTLIYQLRYREENGDPWVSENLTSTNKSLEAGSLLPGCTYEASVRARGKVGVWSEWSPLVTWQTTEGTGRVPNLECVLDGEKELTCSWELKTELASFITYKLTCRYSQIELSKVCCDNWVVRTGNRDSVLHFSCSLTVPNPEQLLLELVPAHNTKTIQAYKHIRPNRPPNVTVREKDGNWIVEWTEPKKDQNPSLTYQVVYWNTKGPEWSGINNTVSGLSFTILGTSLESSQRYKAQVRSVVVPGHGHRYEGVPSEWTQSEEWTSKQGSWSFSTWLYIIVSMSVILLFGIFVCTVPACKRRVVVWYDSVPSPDKSFLSEIKSQKVFESWSLMPYENTYICQVQIPETLSTCSSRFPKDSEKQWLQQSLSVDAGCWDCDNTSPSPETPASFSGPYMFCQVLPQNTIDCPMRVQPGGKEQNCVPGELLPPAGMFQLCTIDSRADYVCLPSHGLSRSTEELVSSHHNDGTSDHLQNSDHDNKDPSITRCPGDPVIQTDLSSSTSRDSTISPWPEGGALHPSGYCYLP